jgi:putative chitinase
MTTNLNQDQLSKIMLKPAAQKNAGNWVAALNAAMTQYSINNVQRQAAFLAQILHESNEFLSLEENMNYSAIRLRQVWPNRFTSDQMAQSYGGKPEKIANFVYSNRMGNGDEASGDGWRFHGRGLIQLTGRANYTKCANALGLDLTAHPELLLSPNDAALSAAWFWHINDLNSLADQALGTQASDKMSLITKRINGGVFGLKERLAYWERAKLALS